MVKGFMDEYEDESGVDLVNSTNEFYDSTNDYYTPVGPDYYTKLLLHLDNNVTDSEITPKTVTNNNVTFSDSIYKFATHSASFNGSTAYLTVPDSDDWNFGTGDFTIDFWFKPKAGVNDLYFQGQSSLTDNDFIDVRIDWDMGGNGKVFTLFIVKISGSYIFNLGYYDSGVVWSSSAWHHMAYVRSGNNFYVFIDGQKVKTQDMTGITMPDFTGLLYIGLEANPSAGNYFNGNLDEYRISKGIARWTSNFTPPTSAYSISSVTENMMLLSNAQVATIVPTSARAVLFEEDVDSVTINTDLKVYVSRDNGTTFSQATLEDEGNYITGARILSGIVDISAQPSGSNMKYKIETLNNKNLKIHGTSVSWKA
jgi:hypothetical protein